jgi:transcriptional repressor NF-X1
LDTRIPAPLLSTYVANTAPPPTLGKLVDLRGIRGPSTSGAPSALGVAATVRSTSPSNSSSWRASTAATLPGRSSTPIGGQRGWAGVVRPPSSTGLGEGNQVSSRPSNGEKPGTSSSSEVQPEASSGREDIPEDWEEDVSL